jgi:hypothetical protein
MAYLAHPRKLLLFVLLSLSDLGLTWLLVERGAGEVYESNPLAGWWLAAFGWLGLAAFKAGTVVTVAGLALWVSRYRPAAGNLILVFACSAVGCVVGYSCYLAGFGVRAAETPPAAELAVLEESSADLQARMKRVEAYRADLLELAADLGAGRGRLRDATRRLARHPQAHDPYWIDRLRERYGTTTVEECLAGNLIVNALVLLRDDPARAERAAHRLSREFRASFRPEESGSRTDWLAVAGVGRPHARHPLPGPRT